MNNDVRKLFINTLKETKEQNKKISDFYKKIKRNNRYLYLEIYEELAKEYKTCPTDITKNLTLEMTFKSFEFASDEDKEIISKLYGDVKTSVGIYNSKHKGKILVNVREVRKELIADGFPNDIHLMDYRYNGHNDSKKDNTFTITIQVDRFINIMTNAFSPLSLIIRRI